MLIKLSKKKSKFIFRKSAPQFLLDIYHRINDNENPDNQLLKSRSKRDLNDEENFVTDLDKKAADDSDVIMTFLNKSEYLKKLTD